MLKAISIGIFAVGAVAAIVGAKAIYDEIKKRQDPDDGLAWDKVKEDRKKHKVVFVDEFWKLFDDVPSSYKNGESITDEVVDDEDICFDDLSEEGKDFVRKFKNLNVCCVRTTSDEEAAEEELDGGEEAVPDDELADSTD